MNHHLSTDISTLFTLLKDTLPTVTDKPYTAALEPLIEALEQYTADLALTAEDLDLSAVTSERRELDAFFIDISQSVQFLHKLINKTQFTEPWMTSHRQKMADFLPPFVEKLQQQAPDFLQRLEGTTQATLAEVTTKFGRWQELTAREAEHQERVGVIGEALDVRFALIGLGRLMGLTETEISRRFLEEREGGATPEAEETTAQEGTDTPTLE